MNIETYSRKAYGKNRLIRTESFLGGVVLVVVVVYFILYIYQIAKYAMYYKHDIEKTVAT